MLAGILSGLAAGKVVSDTLKVLSAANKVGKFTEKVIYPLGIFAISSAVGSIAAKEMDNEIQGIKDQIAGIKEIGRLAREKYENESKVENDIPEETHIHNVFEEYGNEEVENGEG